MKKEIVEARRKKQRQYVEDVGNAAEDQRRRAARERRAAYIARLKASGGYEEFKQRKAAYEKGRLKLAPEYERLKRKEINERWRNKKLNWSRVMLRNARTRARDKNLPCDLALDDIIVPDVCPVLGITLEKAYGNMKACSPSLDRIRPELGYVKGNVRVISQRANRLKCDGTAAEMLLVYKDLLRIEGA